MLVNSATKIWANMIADNHAGFMFSQDSPEYCFPTVSEERTNNLPHKWLLGPIITVFLTNLPLDWLNAFIVVSTALKYSLLT